MSEHGMAWHGGGPAADHHLLVQSEATRGHVPSPIYDLFLRAMAERKQILCRYDGYLRELCPNILGHTKGQEIALTYQFAGQSKSGQPSVGQWKCLGLAKVSDVRLRDGPWYAGSSHTRAQPCVEVVDLDVNPSCPYNPQRRLDTLRLPRITDNPIRPSSGPRRMLTDRATFWILIVQSMTPLLRFVQPPFQHDR
jgi:hypothetical protein